MNKNLSNKHSSGVNYEFCPLLWLIFLGYHTGWRRPLGAVKNNNNKITNAVVVKTVTFRTIPYRKETAS